MTKESKKSTIDLLMQDAVKASTLDHLSKIVERLISILYSLNIDNVSEVSIIVNSLINVSFMLANSIGKERSPELINNIKVVTMSIYTLIDHSTLDD